MALNLNQFLTEIGFTAKYPYTDIHELNLDWIIAQVATLRVEFNDFAHVNSLKYAGEWDITKAYSAFSVVDDQGFGYMALKPVPPGTQIYDTEYWLMVVDYSQILNDVESRITNLETTVGDASSGLVKDVDDLQNDMTTAQGDIIALQTTVGDASSGLVKAVDDLESAMQTAQNDIVTIQGDIININADILDLAAKINAATAIYPTLTDLIADVNVVTGKYVQTLARTVEGDNGGSFYYILDVAPAGYYETLSNGLFAKPINAHNVLVYGVVGSGDETAKINAAIAEIAEYIDFNEATYTISDDLVFTQDINGNGAKIKVTGDITAAITTPGNVYDLEVFSDATAHIRVGIYVTGANSIINNCYVHDLYNDDVSTPNHSVFGILALNHAKNGNVEIKYNRINNIVGTYIVSQTVYSAAGIVFNGESNFVIEENTVSNVIDAYNGDCFSIIPRDDDGSIVGIIKSNKAIGGQVDGFKVSMQNAIIDNNVIRFEGVNPRTTLPYLGIYGIRVQDTHNKIINNDIIDTTSTTSDYVVGIIAQSGGGTVDDLMIRGNNIEGCRFPIYVSNYNYVDISNNYIKSSRRSDSHVFLGSTANVIVNSNTLDVCKFEFGGVNSLVINNFILNCLFDTNIYTNKHLYSSNLIYKSTLNLTTRDIVNGNIFSSCSTALAFVGSNDNIITCNRYVSTPTPTIPAGNVDANNL